MNPGLTYEIRELQVALTSRFFLIWKRFPFSISTRLCGAGSQEKVRASGSGFLPCKDTAVEARELLVHP